MINLVIKNINKAKKDKKRKKRKRRKIKRKKINSKHRTLFHKSNKYLLNSYLLKLKLIKDLDVQVDGMYLLSLNFLITNFKDIHIINYNNIK